MSLMSMKTYASHTEILIILNSLGSLDSVAVPMNARYFHPSSCWGVGV